MENKLKKFEKSDKKFEKRDQGDIARTVAFADNKKKPITSKKRQFPDRGDSNCKIRNNERNSKTYNEQIQIDKKRIVRKKDIISEVPFPKIHNITERRKLHDHYTFKNVPMVPKDQPILIQNLISEKNHSMEASMLTVKQCNVENAGVKRVYVEKIEDGKKTEKIDFNDVQKVNALKGDSKCGLQPGTCGKVGSGPSENSKPHDIPKQVTPIVHKKPFIRTVRSINDATKFYKTVTFVENKPPKYLNVKIPRSAKSNHSSQKTISSNSEIINDVIDKDTPTFTPLPTKKFLFRRYKPKQFKKSKTKTPEKKEASIPPEVPKWDPRCLNQHTKPYYEAWVNTRPTALTLESDKERILKNKKPYIMDYAKLSASSNSPSLSLTDIDLSDEKYTGRITMTAPKRKSKSL